MSDANVVSPVNEEAIQKFAAIFRGEVILPGNANYDQRRRVWNGIIDRYPALIARCRRVEDVITSVW